VDIKLKNYVTVLLFCLIASFLMNFITLTILGFFQVMRKYFNVSEVPLSMQDPYYSSPDISIVCFIPRSDFKREIFHRTSS
jgi:hypothetical protein